jgi:hypothetical protein
MAGDVDGAIDRLRAAVPAAGVAVPDSAGDVEALALLEREIAPFRLPRSLRRLWERVASSNLPAGPLPESSAQLGSPLVGPQAAGDWFGASFHELIGRFPPDAVAVEIRPSD